MTEQIFISYRRSDEPKARLLYVLLQERGVEAWYDAKITAGEDWRNATARALDAAPIFVLLLSKNAADSSDINKELAAATHKNKLIVPVRLENIQLEGAFLYELASRNWIDAFDKPEMRLAELADKLARLVKSDMDPDAASQLQLEGHLLAAGNTRGKKKHAAPAENNLDRGKPEKRSPKALIASAAAAAVILIGGTFAAGLFMMQQNAPAVAAAGSGMTPAAADGQPAATEVASTDTLDGPVLLPAAAVADAAPTVTLADIEAAKAQIAQYADDSVLSNVRADLKSAAAEYKAAGGKVSSSLTAQINEADAAQAAIKAARDAAKGTDGPAILAAAERASKAMTKANDLRPAASQAFLDAKRFAFGANATAARAAVNEMTQLASVKKPGAFASGAKKDAWKFLQDNSTWAQARLVELDPASAGIAAADRKTATRDAAAAVAFRAEMEAALGNSRNVAATLAN